MAKHNDGGEAFPYERRNHPLDYSRGMSLRDWFAGQALIGLCVDDVRNWPVDLTARYVYELADAMLKERE